MTNLYEYKGYSTRIHYSAEDHVLYGKIEGISDLVDFESASAEDIEQEFHAAVDEYLEYCESIGKSPDKEFKGTFNIRIKPEIHRELYMLSVRHNASLNSIVEKACEKFCEDVQRGETIQLTLKQAAQFSAVSSTLTSLQPLADMTRLVSSTVPSYLH